MNTFELIFMIAMGLIIGAIVSGDISSGIKERHWKNRLIEAELAEFVVDSTTGHTTFIIYAEQPTEN